jgi:alpha-ketoglutarate-dependent taurine dioxygenase
MAFEILPLAEPLGAEVRGWKPEFSLSDVDLAQLLRALRRHLVLVFRGHAAPSGEELVDFGSRFGELAPGATIFGDPSEYPEILPITNARDARGDPLGTADTAALNWHFDYSYMPRVGKETFLEAVEIPDTPCPTYFCDSYTALETLPAKRVKELRSLSAYHDVRGAVPEEDLHLMEDSVRRKRERNRRSGKTYTPIPSSEHPVIRRHPDSGREMLYVSPGMTTCLVDMEAGESAVLLAELHAHQAQPELTYLHQWRVGDLVVFDAMGVMHGRDRFDPGERRYMRQMSTLV